jgi:MFS superfamily sulfate permease-like transporter
MAGLAVTIIIGQLPKLFGISIDADGLIQEFLAIVRNLPQTNPIALAIGLIDLALIIGLKRMHSRIPGVVAAVVFSIAVVSIFNLTERGIDVVGVLPQGFPRPSVPSVEFSSIPTLFAASVCIAVVAIGDTISISTVLAARRGYEVDSNRELAGIGSANVLVAALQGFPISTSSSRSAVAEQAGARTQLTGAIAAAAVRADVAVLARPDAQPAASDAGRAGHLGGYRSDQSSTS